MWPNRNTPRRMRRGESSAQGWTEGEYVKTSTYLSATCLLKEVGINLVNSEYVKKTNTF